VARTGSELYLVVGFGISSAESVGSTIKELGSYLVSKQIMINLKEIVVTG
jgi:tryptophan synthase alpha subunit